MSLRSHLKSTIYAIGILPLFLLQPAAATPTNRAVAKRTTVPVKKLDPIKVLTAHLSLNSVQSGENIADICRRADFKLLATALSMNSALLNQEKGEYETTDQYAERVRKLSNAVNANKTIFCQPLDKNEDLPFVYNADLKRFDASFERFQNVWRDVKQLGSYHSKTRMGATATVKASVKFEYNALLTMPQDDDTCGATHLHSSTYNFQVPAAVSEAQVLKARGYVAFIGELVPPYISKEGRSGSPTLDEPYDEYERDLVVSFKPSRIVLVDGGGKEIWSCTPGFLSPNAAPQPKGDASAWISISDYPTSSLSVQNSGVVRFTLTIDKSGTATECAVTASSGSPELDSQTCLILRRRARFKPATDVNANPTSGYWESSFRWKI